MSRTPGQATAANPDMNSVQNTHTELTLSALGEVSFDQFLEPEYALELRKEALAQFQKLGFPTAANEEWKYTNLKSVLSKSYQTEQAETIHPTEYIRELSRRQIQANFLVMRNGRFQPQLSSLIEPNPAIVVSNLNAAKKTNAAIVQEHFAHYASVSENGLNALNTALHQDGVFIHVPKSIRAEYPFFIIHINDAGTANQFSQPRNLFVIGENASATVIESYQSGGNFASFVNVVNEAYVGKDASYYHYKLQQEQGENRFHNNFTQVFQEKGSNAEHVTVTLEGTLLRNNLHFYLNGENCNTLLYGLYLTGGKDLHDNHTRVDHAMPNCFSNELYKGILRDQCNAVFNGKILVHENAQKTNAYQRNQNILLSNEATINTKPQLEIFADDVKCTHGATVGRLDEEALFYLRSRGIGEHEAKRLLLNSFANDIVERIRIPELVTIIEEDIYNKL
jgi:Fe-S cluster assembly protein SufD